MKSMLSIYFDQWLVIVMDRAEYNSGINWASNFNITSTITPWIVWHEFQLLINHNYNKIQEEYDSCINYLTGWYIQLLS